MYELNLDFDPTTVGFDPREITNNGDGTYTVTRRFVHAQHYHNATDGSWDVEAYCPCLTDDVDVAFTVWTDYKGRTKYIVGYVVNGVSGDAESRSFNNSMCDYMHPIGRGVFNRKYGTRIEDPDQEKAASFCLGKINEHPNHIHSQIQREYYEKYHIVFGRSAPTSPQEDPFLPEAFKKMLSANG